MQVPRFSPRIFLIEMAPRLAPRNGCPVTNTHTPSSIGNGQWLKESSKHCPHRQTHTTTVPFIYRMMWHPFINLQEPKCMFHQSDQHGWKHSTLCKVSLDLLQMETLKVMMQANQLFRNIMKNTTTYMVVFWVVFLGANELLPQS